MAACEQALHWGYRLSHARAGAKGNARGFTARSRVLARFTPRNGEILRSLLSGCTLLLGSLSKGVFERRTSTGSVVFFILKYIDATKFVFLSLCLIIETICPQIWPIIPRKNEKSPLAVKPASRKNVFA